MKLGSGTLKEKIRFRIYQSRSIRKMFGLKEKEVYNEELHEFDSSPHIIR
jgi:hypothetical protein